MTASAPRGARVAYAVVHSDPPSVLIAENADVLTRVVALEVIARTSAKELRDPRRADVIRTALLEEQWSEALGEWIDQTGTVIDAYPDEAIWTDDDLDDERISLELRVSRLFQLDPETD
jgi:hypothetical protein